MAVAQHRLRGAGLFDTEGYLDLLRLRWLNEQGPALKPGLGRIFHDLQFARLSYRHSLRSFNENRPFVPQILGVRCKSASRRLADDITPHPPK